MSLSHTNAGCGASVEVASAPGSRLAYARMPKRLFDIALSLTMLPIVLPLIAILYLCVRIEGGPGFFGHVRVGRNGRPFRCWKIRTMVPDAEARLQALLRDDPAARREWLAGRKLRRDPRITRLGAMLRATSLDELPQIWNVLKGDMSLIGPRPVTAAELDLYGAHRPAYLALRPGVTGLWQVSGRNALDYADRVMLDVAYVERVTLLHDVMILARTAQAVLNRTGM